MGDVNHDAIEDFSDFTIFEPNLDSDVLEYLSTGFIGDGCTDMSDFNLFNIRMTEGISTHYR
ncbi:MAG: hypothetical protein WCH34_09260 [Bacteroidota bacterium]